MRIAALIAASSLALLAVPANAATTIMFTNGITAIPGYIGSVLAYKNDFGMQGTPNLGTDFDPNTTNTGTDGTELVTTPGSPVVLPGNVRTFSQDVTGQGLKPLGSTGNFLAIGTPTSPKAGAFQVNFSAGVNVISFLIGSLDEYNSVFLTFVGGGANQVLRGGQITGNVDTDDGLGQQGRVTYDFGNTKLASITFSSDRAAFEIDDIVAAAPEPATWLMMILGFGLVGGALRRRRTAGSLAAA